MTDIVTLTINPAVDISTSVEKIAPFHKLRCTAQLRHPGGGGINVARVIRRLGGEVVALYASGGATGDLLRHLVAAEGVASRTFSIADETREDFSVTEISSDQQYRFVLPGPPLTEGEWQQCLDLLATTEPFPRFVVASGSLPPGVPDDFYARVARVAKHRGAKIILDTSGAPLAAAVAEGVDIIKPNLRELSGLAGRQLSDPAQWEEAARGVVAANRAGVVMLTLGHRGAVLVTREQTLRAYPIPITPRSTVGAGDSFLGAMTWRLASGADLEEAFRYGVAAGAAALLRPGTELCRPDDVARLVAKVITEPA